MSRQVARRTFSSIALGAYLLTALLGAGCSDTSGTNPAPTTGESKTIEESTKGSRFSKGKQPAPAAPEQRRTGRPG
jgi:hypothetical protein